MEGRKGWLQDLSSQVNFRTSEERTKSLLVKCEGLEALLIAWRIDNFVLTWMVVKGNEKARSQPRQLSALLVAFCPETFACMTSKIKHTSASNIGRRFLNTVHVCREDFGVSSDWLISLDFAKTHQTPDKLSAVVVLCKSWWNPKSIHLTFTAELLPCPHQWTPSLHLRTWTWNRITRHMFAGFFTRRAASFLLRAADCLNPSLLDAPKQQGNGCVWD